MPSSWDDLVKMLRFFTRHTHSTSSLSMVSRIIDYIVEAKCSNMSEKRRRALEPSIKMKHFSFNLTYRNKMDLMPMCYLPVVTHDTSCPIRKQQQPLFWRVMTRDFETKTFGVFVHIEEFDQARQWKLLPFIKDTPHIVVLASSADTRGLAKSIFESICDQESRHTTIEKYTVQARCAYMVERIRNQHTTMVVLTVGRGDYPILEYGRQYATPGVSIYISKSIPAEYLIRATSVIAEVLTKFI